MKYKFVTLGCKVNACDSRIIGACLENAGYPEAADLSSAGIIIVNSCAVTAESERKSRSMLRRMKSLYPQALAAVCGCWPRVNMAEAQNIEQADLIVAAKTPVDAAAEIISFLKNTGVTAMPAAECSPLFAHYFEDKTRAAVKVQDGCNRFCTYCIIPYARGRLTSAAPEEAVEMINEITARGCREAVLTGIHLASYDYQGNKLIDLIEKIGKETNLARLRLGSLEPVVITEEFLQRAAAVSCLCPHFHLSLQSGSDAVLRRMNRRYTADGYLRALADIRRVFPTACFTTDVIAGFPGETEEEFAETAAFIAEARFSHVHVFPYSRRRGTKAYDMPGQISNAVKHDRAVRLIALSEETAAGVYADFVGQTLALLPERVNEGGLYEGYTENYLKTTVAAEGDKRGCITPVKIISAEGCVLRGEKIV